MFNGQFEYRVDEKGRVPIPPKFRTEELKKEGVVLCPGIEKCINVYPVSEWKKLASSMTASSIIPSKIRQLNRFIFASSFDTEIDSQGRIMVPSKLRQYAGLNEAVVMAGVNAYIELWSKEQWDKDTANIREEAFHTIDTWEQR
jgi:MraZ protein